MTETLFGLADIHIIVILVLLTLTNSFFSLVYLTKAWIRNCSASEDIFQMALISLSVVWVAFDDGLSFWEKHEQEND